MSVHYTDTYLRAVVTVFLLSFFSSWNSAMRKIIQFIFSLGRWVVTERIHIADAILLHLFDSTWNYEASPSQVHRINLRMLKGTKLRSIRSILWRWRWNADLLRIWRRREHASNGISQQRCNQSARLIVSKWSLTYWLHLIFVVCFR